MRWPRGKYNGWYIEGFQVTFGLHLLSWWWLPRARWNFGEPYLLWLCFTWRAKPSYSVTSKPNEVR